MWNFRFETFILLFIKVCCFFSAVATATPIVNSSISQSTIHSSCGDVAPLRQNYPRTAAQYSLNRAHITLEPTPESNPDSCNISSNYEPMPSQVSSQLTRQFIFQFKIDLKIKRKFKNDFKQKNLILFRKIYFTKIYCF